MNSKHLRIIKIKNFLRFQSYPVTTTDIFEALSQRLNVDISRKTVERDLLFMEDQGLLVVVDEIPQKYVLKQPLEIEVILSIEEAKHILSFLTPEHRVYQVIKKEIGIC